MDQAAKLNWCAVLSAIALGLVLSLQTFPLSSILLGICDGLAVLTMAVTRTRVQMIAKNDYPNSLSSILAARFIIIKAAILLGTTTCVIIDDFISLNLTLALHVVPIGLSCLPVIMHQRDDRAKLGALSSMQKTMK